MHDYRVEMSAKRHLVMPVMFVTRAENQRLAVEAALLWAEEGGYKDVRVQNVVELWW